MQSRSRGSPVHTTHSFASLSPSPPARGTSVSEEKVDDTSEGDPIDWSQSDISDEVFATGSRHGSHDLEPLGPTIVGKGKAVAFKEKMKKPPGTVGRPQSGGYALTAAAMWDKEYAEEVHVSVSF
jgi:hypothetical protein